MTRPILTTSLIATAFALAACGSPDADDRQEASASTAAEAVPAQSAQEFDKDLPETPKADGAAPEKPENDDMKDEVSASSATFPVKYRGRWAIEAADCSKQRGVETTTMTIASDQAQFYESRAKITSATADGDTLTAKLTWDGEGQTWDSQTVFTLKDGGKRLVRADADPAEALTYTKCPA